MDIDIDAEFYKKNYLDIRDLEDEKVKDHFIKYGFWEGRIASQKMLDDRINKNIEIAKKMNESITDYNYKKKNYELINIIIRTSNRPNCFKININSIKQQNYKNLVLHITYDNLETLHYIKNTLSDIELQYNLIEVKKSHEECYYNNYCNIVLENIQNGFIIFLDDDDKFYHLNSLKYINEYLHEDRFLVWEYFRPDKIIGPKKGQVKSGLITSCGCCYHSKYKSKWMIKRAGDYDFVKNLINNNLLKIAKINKVITSAINFKYIYGEGNCIDLN